MHRVDDWSSQVCHLGKTFSDLLTTLGAKLLDDILDPRPLHKEQMLDSTLI